MPDTENPVRVHPTLDKLTIRLDQLRPRKGNQRRGNIDAIAESLERNGQYRPVVVNKPTGEILAGNHPYAAAKRLGWTHIAATFALPGPHGLATGHLLERDVAAIPLAGPWAIAIPDRPGLGIEVRP